MIIFCILLCVIVASYISLKSINSTIQRKRVLNAIKCWYQENRFYACSSYGIYQQSIFMMGDLEPFFDTVFRIFDWGCTRITSPETYEKIKDYIDREDVQWL